MPKRKPCNKYTEVYDPIERRCVSKRDDVGKVIADALAKQLPAGGKPKRDPYEGLPRQSSPGFAAAIERAAETRAKQWSLECRDGKPFAYQDLIRFVADPRADPNLRLGVFTPTGSGKTRQLISVLDNFYADPRPKMVILPDAVRGQFIQEIARWPNRYLKAYARLDPPPGNGAPPSAAWLSRFEEWLQMKGRMRAAGTPGELAAPVRFYSYSTACGAATMRMDDAFIKHSATLGAAPHPLQRKVIVLDEVHTLVQPPAERFAPGSIQMRNLDNLRGELLRRAQHSAVVGLTATPVVPGAADANALMAFLKGADHAHAPDGAFRVVFNQLTAPMYPEIRYPFSRGREDPATSVYVCFVPLLDAGLVHYAEQAHKLAKAGAACGVDRPEACAKLAARANTAFYPQGVGVPPAAALQAQPGLALKFALIASWLRAEPGKTVVMVDRTHGLKVLETMLRPYADDTTVLRLERNTKEERGAARGALARFNALPASARAILLADRRDFNEGVDMINVKRGVLLPYGSAAAYSQAVGRFLRACKNDRGVSTSVVTLVAQHPWLVTSDEVLLARQLREADPVLAAMAAIEADAIGSRLVRRLAGAAATAAARRMTVHAETWVCEPGGAPGCAFRRVAFQPGLAGADVAAAIEHADAPEVRRATLAGFELYGVDYDAKPVRKLLEAWIATRPPAQQAELRQWRAGFPSALAPPPPPKASKKKKAPPTVDLA